MGKGDKPRPILDKDRYDENWTRIFGEKKFHGREREERELPADPDINPSEFDSKEEE